jgi:hypothetical protein
VQTYPDDYADKLRELAISTGIDLSGAPPQMTTAVLAKRLGTTVAALSARRYRGLPPRFTHHASGVRYARTDIVEWLLSR